MKPYACHNRKPFKAITQVQDGSNLVRSTSGYVTREPIIVEAPFRMAPDCQYTHTDLGQADARCVGCKHRAEVGS